MSQPLKPSPGSAEAIAVRWPALTMALRDKTSPVRLFLDQRFSHTREVQARYRASVGPLLVDGSVSPGTLGGAFDWMIRFLVHPAPALDLAALGTMQAPALRQPLRDIARTLGYEIDGSGRLVSASGFSGPTAGSSADLELLARSCWVLTLFTEVFRAGLMPGSPLAELNLDGVRAAQLLDMVPTAAVKELLALRRHAEQTLLPALAARAGEWAIGPTFAGSRLMNADADLIAGGLLLELKTNLGDKRADGGRRASLEGPTIQQLLGYVLLDFGDEFAIREIGVYNARYAHLATWPLQTLLNELAGRPIDLPAERAAFQSLLTSGKAP